MKKFFALSAVSLGFLVLLSGCSSVQFADKFNGLQSNDKQVPLSHINVNISGFYFLGFLPIFSGSAHVPKRMVAFSDTVKTESAVFMLTRSARGIGATRVENIVSTRSGLSLMLFSMEKVQVSATAFK